MRICWKCGERTPSAHQMNTLEMRQNPTPPKPGDISICGGCGAFSVFNQEGNLEKPNRELMRKIHNTPELLTMQAQVKERKT